VVKDIDVQHGQNTLGVCGQIEMHDVSDYDFWRPAPMGLGGRGRGRGRGSVSQCVRIAALLDPLLQYKFLDFRAPEYFRKETGKKK
jgi:hypothetical protein